jgi:serine/threonine-protein kinase
MVARLNPCNPDRLRLLAEDRLPPADLTDLEAHLQSCPACQASLDQIAARDRWLGAARHYLGETRDAVLGQPAGGAGQGLDFLVPSDWPESLGRLGHYEVRGVLGRGGMAVVLKALDPALNRNVAIKVMASHLASCGAARQRFLREAKAAAAVVHEHVVAVHAVEEAGGLPYLVMEYVPGRSLQERIDRQGPLGLHEILRIGMQAAAGLAAAHAQGLVHRDVKPANILLENGVERARLTDFGLARAVDEAALTQSGVVAGTPHYMAPEQARAEAVDHRADLFSLGSTLYAMCTGYPPFRADSAVAVLRRVSDDEPRPVREVNPAVPDWLAALIARLHAKDPGQRYQSAAEVALVLSRGLAHLQQPLAAPAPVVSARPTARPRRRLRLALAGCLAAVLLAGGIFLFKPGQQIDLAGRDVPQKERPAPKRADEIDEELRALRHQVGMFEADLRGRHSHPVDAVEAGIRALEQEVLALEQEITAGQGHRAADLPYRFNTTPITGVKK